MILEKCLEPLVWRHNGCDGVSNRQPHDCLLNRYSGADQRKHQSSASLAFLREIHRWPVNSPHKGPVSRKMFPIDYVIMRTFISRIISFICGLFYNFAYWTALKKCGYVFVDHIKSIFNYILTCDIIWWKSGPGHFRKRVKYKLFVQNTFLIQILRGFVDNIHFSTKPFLKCAKNTAASYALGGKC